MRQVGKCSAKKAFCSGAEEKEREVEEFLHHFVRLMSLLFCTGLQQVAEMSDETFEIINLNGIEEESLQYLASLPDTERCGVVLQWIQRLIVLTLEHDVITIAPPIASRIFQELGQGIQVISEAGAITTVPFPFPYAQLMALLLLMHTAITPIVLAIVLETWYWTAVCAFASVLVFWGINQIAIEIEMPFGDDANDLKLKDMMRSINQSLILLIDGRTQVPPEFNFVPELHRDVSFKPFDPDEMGWPEQLAGLPPPAKRASASRPTRPRVSGLRGDIRSSDIQDQRGRVSIMPPPSRMSRRTRGPSSPSSPGGKMQSGRLTPTQGPILTPVQESNHPATPPLIPAKDGSSPLPQQSTWNSQAMGTCPAWSGLSVVEVKAETKMQSQPLEQIIADRLVSLDEHLALLNKNFEGAAALEALRRATKRQQRTSYVATSRSQESSSAREGSVGRPDEEGALPLAREHSRAMCPTMCTRTVRSREARDQSLPAPLRHGRHDTSTYPTA